MYKVLAFCGYLIRKDIETAKLAYAHCRKWARLSTRWCLVWLGILCYYPEELFQF